MKRYIPLFLAVILLLSACGANNAAPSQTAVPESKPAVQSLQEGEQQPAVTAEAAEQNVSTETDWLAIYNPVLDSYKELLKSESPYDFENEGHDTYGITDNFELYISSMAKPGYCIKDLDGNGVPELLVGLMTDDYFYSRIIAGLFTFEDGALRKVFTSYTRSRYCLSSDGGLIFEGSGGAAYSDYYHCSFSGSSLNTDYGVYSDGDRGFFYCENGDRESAAETESISQDQFSEYYNKLDSMIIDPPEYTMMEFEK